MVVQVRMDSRKVSEAQRGQKSKWQKYFSKQVPDAHPQPPLDYGRFPVKFYLKTNICWSDTADSDGRAPASVWTRLWALPPRLQTLPIQQWDIPLFNISPWVMMHQPPLFCYSGNDWSVSPCQANAGFDTCFVRSPFAVNKTQLTRSFVCAF